MLCSILFHTSHRITSPEKQKPVWSVGLFCFNQFNIIEDNKKFMVKPQVREYRILWSFTINSIPIKAIKSDVMWHMTFSSHQIITIKWMEFSRRIYSLDMCCWCVHCFHLKLIAIPLQMQLPDSIPCWLKYHIVSSFYSIHLRVPWLLNINWILNEMRCRALLI